MVTKMDGNSISGCRSCGNLIDDAARFCPFCGTEKPEIQLKDGNVQDDLMDKQLACLNCGEPRRREAGKYCSECGFEHPDGSTPQASQDPLYHESVSIVIPSHASHPAQRFNEGPDTTSMPPMVNKEPKNTTDRTVAGILAILLGSFGVHKFYMGKIGIGIVYVLFCWTGIPAIVGLIEGILYLTATDEEFDRKYLAP